MSTEKVKAYFALSGREKEIMEFPVSSTTVELTARALFVEPARIALFPKNDSASQQTAPD